MIALGAGALVVLTVLMVASLRGADAAARESAFFEEARALGFRVEMRAGRALRTQLPALGLPGTRRRDDPEERLFETPLRRYRRLDRNPHGDLEDHPDPAMRFPGSGDPDEPYLPAAWREDHAESVVVFRLPEGLREHDPLVLAVNPHATALVPSPPPAVLASLEEEHGWSVEPQGAWLLVYRVRPGRPPEFRTFLDEALAIAHRFV